MKKLKTGNVVSKPIRLCFLAGGPAHFDAPFFQFVSKDPRVQLHVIYERNMVQGQVYDVELGEIITWGFDPYRGYQHTTLCHKKKWLKWLVNDITNSNYDVIIVNGYSSFKRLLATIIARVRGITTALRLDTVLFNNRSFSKRITKYLFYIVLGQIFVYFMPVGSLSRQFLRQKGIAESRMSLFTYAIDVDYFRASAGWARQKRNRLRKSYGIPTDAIVILGVSKFINREAPWDLLRAFCQIRKRKLFLLLVGDGAERSALEHYSLENSLGNVKFAGYIPYKTLPQMYSIADLFVHSATNEVWGVSIAEAMACGLPVIASSRVGSGYDLIRRGSNGYQYVSRNVGDLKGKILLALALDRRTVHRTNKEILRAWDYRATWDNIVSFCNRTRIIGRSMGAD